LIKGFEVIIAMILILLLGFTVEKVCLSVLIELCFLLFGGLLRLEMISLLKLIDFLGFSSIFRLIWYSFCEEEGNLFMIIITFKEEST